MGMTKRDIFFSLVFHFGILLSLTLLNPFNVLSRPNFDAVSVNLISMPPLGNPDLIKGDQMPEIKIPEAIIEEEAAIPISMPESRNKPLPVDKPKPKQETPKAKPKEDPGYSGKPKPGDKSQQGADATDASDQLGPGSKFGSLNVDNPNFQFPTYFTGAFIKIERNWTNPVRSNKNLSCKIHFFILRTGTIMDPILAQSSGVEAYDRACMRALQSSNPLPPLPSEFQDDIIGITLEFPYMPR